jgi:hypothetical protein
LDAKALSHANHGWDVRRTEFSFHAQKAWLVGNDVRSRTILIRRKA